MAAISSKMIEAYTAKETEMLPTFIENPLSGNEPPRCVDGRPSPRSEQGPQMLGGSLHPVVLAAIYDNLPIDSGTVAKEIKNLQEAGVKTGAHRGQHAHGEASDCGFADRLQDILKVAVEKRDEILRRLQLTYQQNRDKLEDYNLPVPEDLIGQAYDKIETYSPDWIKTTGEKLVNRIETSGSTIETVQGDHAETVTFVNIKNGTTMDTLAVNRQHQQGFNLDLLEAVRQAKLLGVGEDFSIPASLILYQATEMVLVEDKGKPALPVQIHF